MNTCLCCRGQLLRQMSRSRRYWFCPYCRQEMPIQVQQKSLIKK